MARHPVRTRVALVTRKSRKALLPLSDEDFDKMAALVRTGPDHDPANALDRRILLRLLHTAEVWRKQLRASEHNLAYAQLALSSICQAAEAALGR